MSIFMINFIRRSMNLAFHDSVPRLCSVYRILCDYAQTLSSEGCILGLLHRRLLYPLYLYLSVNVFVSRVECAFVCSSNWHSTINCLI